MISDKARILIEDWPLGFVATADADGTPNLSPKGTFLVIDDATLAFGEMRSPNTVKNIAVRKDVAVNFIDILSRKGAAVRGTARFAGRGDADFEAHFPRYRSVFGEDICTLFNGLVMIDVTACRLMQSPVYECGASEPGLRREWLEKVTGLYEARPNG